MSESRSEREEQELPMPHSPLEEAPGIKTTRAEASRPSKLTVGLDKYPIRFGRVSTPEPVMWLEPCERQ